MKIQSKILGETQIVKLSVNIAELKYSTNTQEILNLLKILSMIYYLVSTLR